MPDGSARALTGDAWLLVHPRGVIVRREGDRLRFPVGAEAFDLGVDPRSSHDLGAFAGASAQAAAIGEAAALPSAFEVMRLRDLYGAMGEAAFAIAGRAAQTVDWASTHVFCGRCGARTERVDGERCMRCPACSLLSYPRISPAAIVLVRRGDEALLARNAKAPGNFFSTVAGFVEIGESLEETVAREVREEVGVEVTDVRYFGSQPWPVPHSLMIGFVARHAGGEIKVDGVEIVEARWFRADALPLLPPSLSIARQLIDSWTADVTSP